VAEDAFRAREELGPIRFPGPAPGSRAPCRGTDSAVQPLRRVTAGATNRRSATPAETGSDARGICRTAGDHLTIRGPVFHRETYGPARRRRGRAGRCPVTQGVSHRRLGAVLERPCLWGRRPLGAAARSAAAKPPHVRVLRDFENAREIAHRLEKAGNVAIVSGGLHRPGLAAAPRRRGCASAVIEVFDRLMARVLTPQISTFSPICTCAWRGAGFWRKGRGT
jgi:hypothetical protein